MDAMPRVSRNSAWFEGRSTTVHGGLAVALSWASLCLTPYVYADNQTTDLTPMQFGNAPFRLEIEAVDRDFPGLVGLQSGSYCVVFDDSPYLIFIGGRAQEAGMHGFSCPGEENFAAADFNRTIYVVDYQEGVVWQRSLDDPNAGLSDIQADQLAGVNFLDNQIGDYLVMVGGYGYSQDEETWVTFDKMVLIDLEKTVEWVLGGKEPLVDAMQFLSPPEGAPEELYAATGGVLIVNEDEIWLCLGQEYQGVYNPCDASAAVQTYKKDFFRLSMDLTTESFPTFSYIGNSPQSGASWARRRDLNVMPAYVDTKGTRGSVALSGVFTLTNGGWTVPIVMYPDGTMEQPPVDAPGTLRQGFNIYSSARMSAWSESTESNWFVLFGGIGYEFYYDGTLRTSGGLPYSSMVSAIEYTPGDGRWSQHLLGASFPRIPIPDEDDYYRYGTEAYLMPAGEHWIDGRILDLDAIKEPSVVALIYGGITAAGYNPRTGDGPTSASNRFFLVKLYPGQGCPADFDGSGVVDGADLSILLSGWGQVPLGSTSPQDLNDDGFINAVDLSIVLGAWGPCS